MVVEDSTESTYAQILTSLHPIEWLARHSAEYGFQAFVAILFCTEVNPDSLAYIKRTLAKDGLSLDFME
jgi:hypothetical protein